MKQDAPPPIPGADAPATPEQDRTFHSALGRFTGGLSPAALGTAQLDWAMHLIGSPARQTQLFNLAGDLAVEAMHLPVECMLAHGGTETGAMAADRRFADPAWTRFPFNLMAQSFLKQERWWMEATSNVHGTDPAHLRIVNFVARQMMDTLSPSNMLATNPVVLERTRTEHGANLVRGMQNWIEDLRDMVSGTPERDEDFVVGQTVGITPGEVVLRNELIELIRYAPTTAKLHPEPVLIVPAWIMKYYILDLEPRNSMVRYLRDQGFEVYMISWKNPGAEDAGKGMDDYARLGSLAAIDHVSRGGTRKLHAVGYCLGGTLLAATVAHLAYRDPQPVASMTLLAAQVDFTEAGELSLFISESQVAFLEDIMATQGYLDSTQMAGAFTMLRSNDLFWSRIITQYMLGEKPGHNALMAWNADSTRMPARMHSEYLRGLFLENLLARGQWRVLGHTVNLTDIKLPVFAIGTETDHVAPWRSVYKVNLLTDTDVTFVLTSGGHNAGIVSEPGHPRRHYRIADKPMGAPHLPAENWLELAEERPGSWWEPWAAWLAAHSGAPTAPETAPDASLGPAPGTYVFG